MEGLAGDERLDHSAIKNAPVINVDTIADRSISGDKLINGTITFRQVANDALGAMKMDFRGTRGDADVIIRYRPDLGGGAWVWAKADNTIFDTENEVEIGAPLVAAADGKLRWGGNYKSINIPVSTTVTLIPGTYIRQTKSSFYWHYMLGYLNSPRVTQADIDSLTHFRVLGIKGPSDGDRYRGVGYHISNLGAIARSNLGSVSLTEYPDFTNFPENNVYLARLEDSTDYVVTYWLWARRGSARTTGSSKPDDARFEEDALDFSGGGNVEFFKF